MTVPRRPAPGRSLAEERPDLASEWTVPHLDPHDVGVSSAFDATWECGACGHSWTAKVYSRSRGSGCPECARLATSARRSQASPDRSLAILRPVVAEEWDADRNQGQSPRTIAAMSRYVAAWVCRDCSHRWTAPVNNRSRGHGCPACFARRHSQHMSTVRDPAKSLAVRHPEIAAEWDSASPLNQGALPATVMSRSRRTRGWICSVCSERFESSPDSRCGRQAGCPSCRRRSSREEAAVLAAVRELFPDTDEALLPRTDGLRTRAWQVDACSHEARLIVEYDGSYWHSTATNPRAEASDRAKSADLRSQGWTVVRVREAPLTRLHQHDLVVPFQGDTAERRSLLLEHIEAVLADGSPGRIHH